MSERVVGVGDEIASDFGRGEIVAITEEWVVHKTGRIKEGEREAAIRRENQHYWIPVEGTEEGVKEEKEMIAKEADQNERD